MSRCILCGKSGEETRLVNHHISYREDRTVTLCQSCHIRVHKHPEEFFDLQPIDKNYECRLTVCVDDELKELVEEVAKARGEDVSDFVRRAIKTELGGLGYLSEEERKALGLG